MDDGREAYTRNPVFLCWFNQIKPRNAKNRRTLNRAAPFRSFFVKEKKKRGKKSATPIFSTPFEFSLLSIDKICLVHNVSSSSFFFFLKRRKIGWSDVEKCVFEKEKF